MRHTIIVGMLAGLLAATSAQATPTLSFSPTSNSAAVGNALSYDLRISGLGADFVSTFDISIGYNTSLLGLNSVLFGSGLNLGNLADSLQFNSGTVNVTETSLLLDLALLALQPDDFVLFTLNFTGLAAGTTALTLTVNDLGGETVPDPFTGLPSTQRLASITQDGRAEITAGGGGTVPEPATYGLAGLALLGLAASRRRR